MKLPRIATVAILALLGACATKPPAPNRENTAAALDRILNGDHRAPESRARDPHRHPKETLLFFGLRSDMKVIEIWPAAGWYTEVIAPLIREPGQYVAAQFEPNPESQYITGILDGYRAKLAARPDLYDKVQVVTLGPQGADIAPPDSVDLIVTFRNIHNWMPRDFQKQAFEIMYRALKPGGVLGVEEHRGKAGVPQDPKAKSGYVNEDYAVALIQSVGFRLEAKSEVNANPQDTKDYEQGVWTLPPTYRLGDKDKAKYMEIGESDRFTLKFVKPGK